MGGCQAMNCSNRRPKFRLHTFPADKERRNRWIINCRRENFIPGRGAELCEVHFEENQYNHKPDGTRLGLKWNAVPTLFNVPNPPKKFNPSPRKSLYKKTTQQESQESISPAQVNTDSAQKSVNKKRQRSPSSTTNLTQEPPEKRLQQPLWRTSTNIHGNSSAAEQNENPRLYTEEEVERMVNDILEKHKNETIALEKQCFEKSDEIVNELRKENEALKKTLDNHSNMLKSFLNADQIAALGAVIENPSVRVPVREWSNETIIKALKFRFALGVHGHEYLRETGYPIPSYRTLCRRLEKIETQFGIFTDLKTPLLSKIEDMDKFCILSIDEMQISDATSVNKHTMKFQSEVTLGSKTESVPCVAETDTDLIDDGKNKGNQLFVALLRGAKNPWKQAVGCHITNSNTSGVDLRKFLFECINFANDLGLQVIALSSDMGYKNRRLWNELGICIKKTGSRINMFMYNKQPIYVVADQCHLLKNLKGAILDGTVSVPQHFVDEHKIVTNEVAGYHIKNLWYKEVNENRELRLLHHLKEEDINPDNFQKMHVGAAVRFFSLQTATAIEVAVKLKELPEEAVATAKFIKYVNEWFEMVNSKIRKTSITRRNQEQKLEFLSKFITTIDNIEINKGWKPLNTGLILTSLSLIDISHFLFQNQYDFILTHRFTQDALENVFSQVRRRAGKLPSPTDCLKVMKLISISQFVSDIQRTNYTTDSDITLIEYAKTKQKDAKEKKEIIMHKDHTYYFDKYSPHSYYLSTAPLQEQYEDLDLKTLNLIYNIGGSTVNSILKKCCSDCSDLLQLKGDGSEENEFMKSWRYYKNFLNMGGLKDPSPAVVQLLINCELTYKTFRGYIIHHGASDIVKKIVKEINIVFPKIGECCCTLKDDIVKHYFIVRNYTVVNFSKSTKKKKTVYGSASQK